MIDLDKLRERTSITIEIEPEDMDPINSFGYDTEEENEDAARYVRELADRTPWGWCVVIVRAKYAGLEGRDVLGWCSYESEAAFKEPGGYYEDMVRTALHDLAAQLEATDAALAEVRL